MAAGGAERGAAGDDARAGQRAFVDRALQSEVDVVVRADIADGGEAGVERALGVDVRCGGLVDGAFAENILVEILRLAGDVRVAVDETRQQRDVAEVDDLRAGGEIFHYIGGGADGDDAVALDDDGLVVEHFAGGGVDEVRGLDDRDGLGSGVSGEQ